MISRLPIVYANIEHTLQFILDLSRCISFDLYESENLQLAQIENANVHERKACLPVRNEVANKKNWTQEFLFVVALLNQQTKKCHKIKLTIYFLPFGVLGFWGFGVGTKFGKLHAEGSSLLPGVLLRGLLIPLGEAGFLFPPLLFLG